MSNNLLNLTRTQIATFAPDPRAIRAFEQMLEQVSTLIPEDITALTADITALDADITALEADVLALGTDIEEVDIEAGLAQAKANQALAALQSIAQSLELLAMAPIPPLGTMSEQNSDRVAVTGGAIEAALTNTQTTLLTSSATLTDGAAAAAGTLTNAPSAGDPTKWVAIDDNGTTRYIPAW